MRIPEIQFNLAYKALEDLLREYKIDVKDPDVQQMLLNAAVAVENIYINSKEGV